jgi:1,4-dihydroxy-2-naphthoate octaprenyltransferase
MQLNTIAPVMLGCAMLWWIGRRMSWTRRLVVMAITLAVIICVLLFERSGF